MKKISLTPEQKAALHSGGDVLTPAKPFKPLIRMAQMVIHKQVAKLAHGPSMRPTLRQQLLHFPSYSAFKASWVADNFQRMCRERTRN